MGEIWVVGFCVLHQEAEQSTSHAAACSKPPGFEEQRSTFSSLCLQSRQDRSYSFQCSVSIRNQRSKSRWHSGKTRNSKNLEPFSWSAVQSDGPALWPAPSEIMSDLLRNVYEHRAQTPHSWLAFIPHNFQIFTTALKVSSWKRL